MAIFRGAADCRFARESGQRNRLDRPVVEHCCLECPVRFADARGRVKMGEDSGVACDADLLPWCL
jgi:hypothetical protein